MYSMLDKNDARHIQTHTKDNIGQSEFWQRINLNIANILRK
jgi:hypothetical protein